MTAIYVLLSVCILLSAAAVLLTLKLARSRQNTDGIDEARLREELANTVKMENSMLTGTLRAQTDSTKELTGRFDNFMTAVDRKLDDMKTDNARNLAAVREDNARNLTAVREDNQRNLNSVREESAKSLDAVRRDNAEQLEKMRQTVDEKLASTLEQRFNDSFKLVGARLQEINTTFNALQGLQSDVNDLNKIFKNVKTRGTWGEVSLENLLCQILTPDQYIKQAAITRGESEEGRVDFAIKLPGQGDGTVLLPVDAKFPLEDYQRLVDASAAGDYAETELCVKALCDAILKQGRSIRDKYIRTPKTTDFAIMYLPVEGLYSEVVKRTDLLGKLQNECKVVVCGPTTLSALLNSLRMGFRSVAIEQRSKEISKLLGQFQKDFGVFSKYLEQLKTKMGTVQDTIGKAQQRSKSIGDRLSKVTKLEIEDGDVDLIESISSVGDLDDVLSDVSTGDDDEG